MKKSTPSLVNRVIKKISKNIFKELFKNLNEDDKVERLSTPPYKSGRFYHATDKKNFKSILTSGIKGSEIWVSKDKPLYDKGILFELNIDEKHLKRDPRWKDSDQVFVSYSDISSNKITRFFDYFDNISMREDELAEIFQKNKKDKNFIKKFILENNL